MPGARRRRSGEAGSGGRNRRCPRSPAGPDRPRSFSALVGTSRLNTTRLAVRGVAGGAELARERAARAVAHGERSRAGLDCVRLLRSGGPPPLSVLANDSQASSPFLPLYVAEAGAAWKAMASGTRIARSAMRWRRIVTWNAAARGRVAGLRALGPAGVRVRTITSIRVDACPAHERRWDRGGRAAGASPGAAGASGDRAGGDRARRQPLGDGAVDHDPAAAVGAGGRLRRRDRRIRDRRHAGRLRAAGAARPDRGVRGGTGRVRDQPRLEPRRRHHLLGYGRGRARGDRARAARDRGLAAVELDGARFPRRRGV